MTGDPSTPAGATSDDPVAGDPRSMRERMRDGDWYRAVDDPEIVEAQHRGTELADACSATTSRQEELRGTLLRQLLGAVGEGATIRPPLIVDDGTDVRIGARCFVDVGLTALDVADITIGDDVQIGPHVQLLTPTHPLDPALRRAGREAAEPITVEDGVWLGGGVVVCPGVTIGRDTVVGSPARVLRPVDAATATPDGTDDVAEDVAP